MENKVKDEIKEYTAEEWRKEGYKLFGENWEDWKFKCPNCGNIASGREFKEVGANPDDMYCECIGRYRKDKGCNWAAYGLFNICKVKVNGSPVFEFAQ